MSEYRSLTGLHVFGFQAYADDGFGSLIEASIILAVGSAFGWDGFRD